MAIIVHRHPEDLRSGTLRIAALLAVMAILLAIIIVQQFGGGETASTNSNTDIVGAEGTAYAGMLPRSDFASDNDWLKAHGFPPITPEPAAPGASDTTSAGVIPRSNFESDID